MDSSDVTRASRLQGKRLTASAAVYLGHLVSGKDLAIVNRVLLGCPPDADAWHVQAAVVADLQLAAELHVSPDSIRLPVVSPAGETLMLTREDAERVPGAALFGYPLAEPARDGLELPTMDSNFCLYETRDLVGQGQTAKVFSAVDALGIPYAVKLMEMSRLAVSVGNLLELDISRRLHHPRLLHCVRVITPVSCPYVRSPALVTNLYAQQRAPEGYAQRRAAEGLLAFMRDVAAGLAFLHRNQLLHCDVKPENFLASPGGRGLLADFGSARYEHSTAPFSGGTRYYLAPELMDSEGMPSVKSDVWAYAVSFADLLLGGPGSLFGLDGFEASYADFVERPRERLAQQLAGVGADALFGLLASCFARDPALRPSVSELLADPLFPPVPPCPALASSPPLRAVPARAVAALLALCEAHADQPAAVAFAAADLLYAYWHVRPADEFVPVLFWAAAGLVGDRSALGGVQTYMRTHRLEGRAFLAMQYALIEASTAGLLRSKSLLSLSRTAADLAYCARAVLSVLPENPDKYLDVVPETVLAQARAEPRAGSELPKAVPYSLLKDFVSTA